MRWFQSKWHHSSRCQEMECGFSVKTDSLWFLIFKNYLKDMSPFCGAIDSPVLDFWWRLPWDFNARCGSFTCILPRMLVCHGILRFTSGATPADLLTSFLLHFSWLSWCIPSKYCNSILKISWFKNKGFIFHVQHTSASQTRLTLANRFGRHECLTWRPASLRPVGILYVARVELWRRTSSFPDDASTPNDSIRYQ